MTDVRNSGQANHMATSKKTASPPRNAKNVKAAKAAKGAKRAAKAKTAKSAARAADPEIVVGAIAHTEFASTDPAATKTWAAKTLGWSFQKPMPMPGGDYHMWESGKGESGGVRNNMPAETPGTIVYVAVANMKRAYEKALKHGATPMLPPEAIGGGMGQMAIVNAPGGVAIGLWSMK